MASKTQTMEANDSLNIHRISDAELSKYFDFDAGLKDVALAATEPSFEDLYLQIQSANEASPAENQLMEASPDPTGADSLVINLASSTGEQPSKPLLEACSGNAANVGGDTVCEPRSATKAESQIETQIRYLRHKLQKGLLIKGQQPKVDDMSAMSSFLKKLEKIENPPETAIRSTRILRVLKEIMKLVEIPRDGEFHMKDRATSLFEKWNATLVPMEQPDATSTAQRQSVNASEPLVIDLTEESASEHSTESTSDHAEELGASLSASNPDELASFTALQSNLSLTADATPNKRKRKYSKARGHGSASVADKSTGGLDPPHRRTKRKTSMKEYLGDQNVFMTRSLKEIDKMLEENAEEMEFVRNKRARLTSFKEEMIAWGAQDERVTKEWEQLS